MKDRGRNLGIALLLAVGLLQPVGFLFNFPELRGLGQAWVSSPLPLVFSHFRGLETFSSRFDVKVTTQNGSTVESQLTPQIYALLGGPYQRRNAYGAVVAYGPKLTESHERAMVSSVLQYGFCRGPLVEFLKITDAIRSVSILVSNTVTPLESNLEVQCD